MAQQIGQTNPTITLPAGVPTLIAPSRSVNSPRTGIILNNTGGQPMTFGFSTAGVAANITIPLAAGGQFLANATDFAGNNLPNGDIWGVSAIGTTCSFTEW